MDMVACVCTCIKWNKIQWPYENPHTNPGPILCLLHHCITLWIQIHNPIRWKDVTTITFSSFNFSRFIETRYFEQRNSLSLSLSRIHVILVIDFRLWWKKTLKVKMLMISICEHVKYLTRVHIVCAHTFRVRRLTEFEMMTTIDKVSYKKIKSFNRRFYENEHNFKRLHLNMYQSLISFCDVNDYLLILKRTLYRCV